MKKNQSQIILVVALLLVMSSVQSVRANIVDRGLTATGFIFGMITFVALIVIGFIFFAWWINRNKKVSPTKEGASSQ